MEGGGCQDLSGSITKNYDFIMWCFPYLLYTRMFDILGLVSGLERRGFENRELDG